MWIEVINIQLFNLLKCCFSMAPHLDALLELVSGGGRAFAEQLTEDDDLLKKEDPALFAARQDARVLLCHKERLLLQ